MSRMKYFSGVKNMKIVINNKLETFESFDYQCYLHMLGFNMLEFKQHYLKNLPSESTLINRSDKGFAVITKKSWDERILGVPTYSIDDIFIQKGMNNTYKELEVLLNEVIDYIKANSGKLTTIRFGANKFDYIPDLSIGNLYQIQYYKG